ncbi:MAG: hypothetical protein ABSC95_08725 [Acetobacteraceae bacterium]
MPPKLLVPVIALLIAIGGNATACDLRLEPSEVFGGTCKVLVGYFNSNRVGPFHVFLPDGSSATAGTCDGYVGVSKVDGNVVSLEPFHAVPASVYTLADDCRHSVKNR